MLADKHEAERHGDGSSVEANGETSPLWTDSPLYYLQCVSPSTNKMERLPTLLPFNDLQDLDDGHACEVKW